MSPDMQIPIDEETLVDRAHAVALLAEALRMDPVWRDAGDTGRRRVAKRIGYQRWRHRAEREAREGARRGR